MKLCSKCNKELTLDLLIKSGRGDHRKECKDCYNEWRRRNYPNSTTQEKEKLRTRQRKYKHSRRIALYLREHPCVDCGEDDILTLEFDHIEDKLNCISNLGTYGWKKVLEEINRCEVRCGSCHAKKTHERAQDTRYKMVHGLWIEELGIYGSLD